MLKGFKGISVIKIDLNLLLYSWSYASSQKEELSSRRWISDPCQPFEVNSRNDPYRLCEVENRDPPWQQEEAMELVDCQLLDKSHQSVLVRLLEGRPPS